MYEKGTLKEKTQIVGASLLLEDFDLVSSTEEGLEYYNLFLVTVQKVGDEKIRNIRSRHLFQLAANFLKNYFGTPSPFGSATRLLGKYVYLKLNYVSEIYIFTRE